MKPLYTAIFALLIHSASAQNCGDRYSKNLFHRIERTAGLVFGESITSDGQREILRLDVFDPIDDTMALRPLIILLHGGAYWSGNKNINEVVIPCRELAKRGFVTASPGYRIEPTFLSLLFEDRMIKAVARGTQDTRAAVRYFYRDVIENGNTWRIDTNKIFVGGFSAGALNSLHLVYLDDINEMVPEYRALVNEVGGLEGTSGNAGFSDKVIGVININGALGSAEYMNNNTTPFLSIHNTGDPQIPFYHGRPYDLPTLPIVDGSAKLHEKAQELGIYNPFWIIDNHDHTSSDFFGLPVQPYLDSTLWYISQFTRHELGCEEIPTNVPKPFSQKPLNIYPNPSSGIMQMDVPGLQNRSFTVTIMDNLGRVVAQEAWTPGSYLDTRKLGLSPGVYYVTLKDEEEFVGGGKINITK